MKRTQIVISILIVIAIITLVLIALSFAGSSPTIDDLENNSDPVATTTTNDSLSANDIFTLLPQTEELLQGENDLFGYRITAPQSSTVRVGTQRFTLTHSNVSLSSFVLTVYDENNEVVTRVPVEAHDPQVTEQVLEFPLRDFTVPRDTSYSVWVTANIDSVESGGTISLVRKGLGQRLYFSNTSF